MSQKQMVQFGGQNVTADDSASNATLVMRGSAGEVVGTTVQGSQLKSTGNVQIAGAAKTVNFTAAADGTFYECDATSGSITAALPPASSVPNQVYVFQKINSANSVVIDGDGTETINGATTQTLTTQYSSLRIRSNGVAWYSF